MKKTNGWLFAALLMLISTFSFAQDEQEQRIRTSYLMAFGRDASSGEVTYWKGQGNRSVGDLYNNHKAYIKSDNTTRRQAIIKSYVDALGYNPSEAEITYHSQFNRTYTEMMQQHMNYVSQNASEYDKVIRRSYKAVFNRTPNDGELAYWKGQAKCSYFILVSYHESYKRANQTTAASGGNKINFANVPFAVSLSVSNLVAKEAAGIIAAGGGNVIGQNGATMVAAGGGNMVAAGGGNMVAAGGGNMVAAGGGN
jgi:hypothetical protein